MREDCFSRFPVPEIRRARGYFLYSSDGRRFLDFFLDNGHAFLGHRVPGMQRIIKSTVSRGLLAAYPSVYSGRAERMIKKLFPRCREVGIYRNNERLHHAAASALGKPVHSVVLRDPLFYETGDLMLWRPQLPWQYESVPLLVPVFPLPGYFSPRVVVSFRSDIVLPPSDTVSPFFSDLLVKAVSGLSGNLSLPPENVLSPFDAPFWDRKGRYLLFKNDEDTYRDLYVKALSAGVFLPPSTEYAAIIPPVYEQGQVRKFLGILKEME